MLEEDRKPTPALLRAAERYKNLVGWLTMDKNDKNLVLSDRDRDIFLEELETPSEPNEKLKEAAKKHKDSIRRNTKRYKDRKDKLS